MLAAPAQDEREVLLAQERAHLRDGHHWQRAVVEARPVALDPLGSTRCCGRPQDAVGAAGGALRRRGIR